MIWIDSIYDLQYYNQPKTAQCYCEMLIFPNDMQLQGHVYNGSGSYTLNIYVYSADGMTQYEDATSYFEYYFAAMPGGQHFFNARLKSYSPAMCSHACFILKAVVTSGGTTLFDKYTERYCITDCCDVARGIATSQAGLVPAPGGGTVMPTFSSTPNIPVSECGDPLIRLISRFDCIDNFTGDFYGTPETVLSGSASFEYTKISNLKGRIVRRPREIERDLSYNCKLQRAQSTPTYLLEGFEYFPAWKMYEIEGQLHANNIYVDDFRTFKQYQYGGGTAFKLISNCVEVFKLETTLEECMQRQVFGCNTDCKQTSYDGSNMMFAIPESYEGGAFYNESGLLIAEDYDGLLTYYRSRQGVSAVNDINVSGLPCTVHKAFGVIGSGYIDRSFYVDSAIAANRVYGKTPASEEELCEGTAIACKKPVAGTIDIETMVCAVPVTGTVVVSNFLAETITMNGYGDWTLDSGSSSLKRNGNEMYLSIKVDTTSVTADPANPTAPVYVAYVPIAVLGSNARPSTPVVISHANSSSIPEGLALVINTNGIVRATGNVTAADASGATIELNNLYYTI